jgi:metallo-beta-lactamase family protein
MIRSGGYSVLLDCGLYQGRREETYRRNAHCAFDPSLVHAVVQSHAHIDHSGKLPMLVRNGFTGPIHATSATRDLCDILLRDSAHIMLNDARYLNEQRMRRKLLATRHHGPRHRRGRARAGNADRDESRRSDGGRRGRGDGHGQRELDRSQPGNEPSRGPHDSSRDHSLPSPVDLRASALLQADLPAHELLPLYIEEDVRDALRLFIDHDYGTWFEVAPNMRFRFHDAGHILGSAWIEGEIREKGGLKRLVFTGDYGRKHQAILRDPEPLTRADVYISESTYGNRVHPPIEGLDAGLAEAVVRLATRGRGRLLVPAFAVGRTQNILYSLSEIYRQGRAPPIDIVVDSPLATAATRVVMNHHECFDEAALHAYQRMEGDPSFRSRLTFTESVEESKALNQDPRPLIIVSASGMMENGRILHHLAWNIDKPETEILIVGFQAEHTLGRKLIQHATEVNILGMRHTVRASVTAMLGFSAHADRNDLLAALEPHAAEASSLFLVHGEEDQRKPLGRELAARGFRRVEEPVGPEAYRA